MNRIKTMLGAALCASSLSLGAMGVFAPPTNAEIEQRLQSFNEWQAQNPDKRRDFTAISATVARLFGDLNVAEMNIAQIGMIAQFARIVPDLNLKVERRLGQIAEANNADGATAATMLLPSAFQQGEDEMRRLFQRALTHPGLGAALESGRAGDLLSMVGYLPEPVLKSLSKEIKSVSVLLDRDLPPEVVVQSVDYLAALNKLSADVDDDFREGVRQRLLELLATSAERLTEEQRMMGYGEFMDGMKAYLNGAYARGRLIDHDAPKMTFAWSSAGTTYKSIEDLRGKVVLIDFWATWCGPCISSFPNIRELVDRYNGYDVVVLGVTSLQGNHFKPGGERISTEGNPTLEYELMAEFIKEMDMTWPVVFSEQEVFNVDYGVRGIPHVAIIAPDGKVRFNAMHPASPLAEKAEKIDKLLKDAGKPAPAPIPNNPVSGD